MNPIVCFTLLIFSNIVKESEKLVNFFSTFGEISWIVQLRIVLSNLNEIPDFVQAEIDAGDAKFRSSSIFKFGYRSPHRFNLSSITRPDYKN